MNSSKNMLVIGLFLTFMLFIPVRVSFGDDFPVKIRASRTHEDHLRYKSAVLGYYVNPADDAEVLPQFLENSLTATSSGLDKASRWASRWTLGTGLESNRFDYGVEFAVSKIGDRRITNQIDLSLIPKVRYWFSEERGWYTSAGLGVGYDELEGENRPDLELHLGGHLFFAPEVEIARRISVYGSPFYLGIVWIHRSNGDLEDKNSGWNVYSFQVSRLF